MVSILDLKKENNDAILYYKRRYFPSSLDSVLKTPAILLGTHAICLLKNTVKITCIIISNSIYDIGDGQIRIPQIGPGSVQADAL